MRKPNRTARVMEGLATLADALDERGPLAVFEHGVDTNEEEAQWRGVVCAKNWIRAWQRYDDARRGEEAPEPPGGCLDDT
jgi:hypothetical protein